ncbi:uncharacterized protein BXZ73DRAFT_74883 [Epithele typhae]|uniref:uncharacterized protein n=1 Tax=Epithele typhae TaxID=378194 RepID=UPI002007F7A1|nr:uncharacterized protein BXZ73DRAFT_74883 [Epithele typhae]KAH9941685.1 hypothetical protein BXZ73DRAFT_74883 [Epithele typhae]
MESQIALSAYVLAVARWYHEFACSPVNYDYFLTLDTEIQYVWSRKITSAGAIYVVIRYFSLISNILTFLNFFPWPGKSSPVRAFLRPDKVLTHLTPLTWQICNALVLGFSLLCTATFLSAAVLGSGNAVPSLYGAIKTRANYNPGPDYINAMCNADFSQFATFRKGTAQQGLSITTAFFQNGVAYFAALLVVNIMNLVFINNVQPMLPFIQLLFNFIGVLTAMTVVLTCRFILDLFEASTRGRFGTVPTLHLSAVRSLAFPHVGGVGATGVSGGIFGADLTMDTGAPRLEHGQIARIHRLVRPPVSQETPFTPSALGTGARTLRRTRVSTAPCRTPRCTVRSRRGLATAGADLPPSTTESVDGVGYVLETDVTEAATEWETYSGSKNWEWFAPLSQEELGVVEGATAGERGCEVSWDVVR